MGGFELTLSAAKKETEAAGVLPPFPALAWTCKSVADGEVDFHDVCELRRCVYINQLITPNSHAAAAISAR